MKTNNTHPEYLRRVNLAIKFILDNLDQNPSLAEISTASHFSAFHFHRIFLGVVGETVNDFVTRKKMENAACTLLAQPDLSITNIAELGGFSSSANFAKAFKLYFGVTPSQLRNSKNIKDSKIGKIYRKYGKAFNPQDLYSQFVTNTNVFNPDKLKDMLMNIKVEEFAEKQIAYLTAPKGYDLDSIFETWDKVINWAKAKGIADEENKRFAITHDNPMITPTAQCRYDAGILIDESIKVLTPFSISKIPAGEYAVAYYKGQGDRVSNFYMELYSNWLPTSGFEPDDFPPVAHYLNDSRVDGYTEMEILIKLKTL